MKTHLQITGILTGTPDIPAKPHGKYVYQKTKAGLGNVPGDKSRRKQCRIWTRGTYSNTPAQQPFRARFADGVSAWHALTPSQKELWRKPGAKLHLNRFQAFMRYYLRSEPLPEAYRMEIELDMTGSGGAGSPTISKTFEIVDANIVAGNLLTMAHSARAATGRAQDENEMDSFACRAIAYNGGLTAYIDALAGPVAGLYRFIYTKE